MQGANVAVDAWLREDAGERLSGLQQAGVEWTCHQKEASHLLRIRLCWHHPPRCESPGEEFFQTTLSPTFTVIAGGTNPMSVMPTVPWATGAVSLAKVLRIAAAESLTEQLGASSSSVSTTKLGTCGSSTSTTLPK